MSDKEEKKTSKSFLKTLQKKEVRDYTYAILFFLVASFFAFFVIRPVLSIAISLQREAKDLEQINKMYEANISEVLRIQADLEEIRPKAYLLDEALPDNPELKPLIEQIKDVARSENVKIEKVAIQGLQIKGRAEPQPNTVRGLKIGMSINGSYADVSRYIKALKNQRRIKSISSISLKRDRISSSDGDSVSTIIRLRMDVQAYHF